ARNLLPQRHCAWLRVFVACEVCRMPGRFGARLRQQHERQQITLISIAEQTKINVSLLEALERDDVSHWPAGIFRRAFIRAYAQAIGLDPAVVVGEFLELYPDPIEVVPPVSVVMPDVGGASASPRPPTRFRYLVESIGSLFHLRPGVVQMGSFALESSTTADRSP